MLGRIEPSHSLTRRIIRVMMGGGLFLLSFWVNISTVILAAPLLCCRHIWKFLDPESLTRSLWCSVRWGFGLKKTLSALGILMIAFGLNILYVRQTDLPHTSMNFLSVSDWLSAWSAQAKLLWREDVFRKLMIGSGVLAAWILIYGICQDQVDRLRSALMLWVLMLLPGVIYLFVVGVSHHVYYSPHFRYTMPLLFFLLAGGSAWVGWMVHLRQSPRLPVLLNSVLSVILLSWCGLVYGSPSIRGVEKALHTLWGRQTEAVIDNHCTHVMGDYWKVWPVVFWSNHLLHQSSHPRTVYGITFRCGPTATLWASENLSKLRIAGIEPIQDAYTEWGEIPELPTLQKELEIRKINMGIYRTIAEVTSGDGMTPE